MKEKEKQKKCVRARERERARHREREHLINARWGDSFIVVIIVLQTSQESITACTILKTLSIIRVLGFT